VEHGISPVQPGETQDLPPAAPGERYEDLIEVFTVLSRTLAEDESVQDTLQSILALALRLIPGCSAASVTVLDEQGQPSTIAATDEDTLELDRRQYLLNDGPCMDAARRQQVNRWSLIEAEQHWPGFTSLAKELGLRSYLAAGLGLGDQRLGALNLSSRDTDGFSRLDEGLVALFIAPAAAAIVTMTRYGRARDLADQLNQAMRSRAVIDQALGIIMAESKIDAQRAFAVLSRASNNRRMKLRDLAAEIVARVSGQAPAEYADDAQP
jgi:GAF domain-containing protein